MISSYNLPQQIFVSGLACAAELERRALGPVRLYCAGRAGPAIRFRPPKHEVPTASHCIVNSWYQWSPNSAFKEIWAYSPIEWARWFAKNFATPKDIERTESWQHLRQAYSRLNIKIYEIWCLTMFYPDIIWHPPESCWISTKTQEKLIKLSDGENDGLLKSIAETQRADMLMGDSLADAFVQPVDCDLYVLGSDCDQIWPSESSLKYQSTANEGSFWLIWRIFYQSWGLLPYMCCLLYAFYFVYMLSCVSNYLVFVRIQFPWKTSTWMWNLEFSVADLWPAVMWHKAWRALSASLWRHAGNLENLQQRHGESKVLPRWGLQDYIEG